jgi:hypothetical protein
MSVYCIFHETHTIRYTWSDRSHDMFEDETHNQPPLCQNDSEHVKFESCL